MSYEFKGTPGEWCVGMRQGMNADIVYCRDGANQHEDSTVCQVYGIAMHKSVEDVEDNEGLRNAQLIAAAPEVLNELKKTHEELCALSDDYIGTKQYYRNCAALTKATGGEG